MQGPSRYTNGWWVSPAIPTTANCTLALLWGFSGFGGWGESAFCAGDAIRDPHCVARFGDAVAVSLVPAAVAAAIALAAWMLPRIRRDDARLDRALTISALVWFAAVTVLFVGGLLAKA
ncbi:hypothetical protein [Actinomadura alba]|uniref:Uncharacterized protein n=1 Tax=Actinomadura alba TaxID=406431 RepID=A0ABR7LLL6_9ACTN|nr:hypothetical protein [Actinomadura alba]MBC6465630.1 hypothetical protein [Actinomadura alba]